MASGVHPVQRHRRHYSFGEMSVIAPEHRQDTAADGKPCLALDLKRDQPSRELIRGKSRLESSSEDPVQRFKIVNRHETDPFGTGHTSQPTSMELLKISKIRDDDPKKHHIISDSHILKYIKNATDLDKLDGWALAALRSEIGRLQHIKEKLPRYRGLEADIQQLGSGLSGGGGEIDRAKDLLGRIAHEYPRTRGLKEILNLISVGERYSAFYRKFQPFSQVGASRIEMVDAYQKVGAELRQSLQGVISKAGLKFKTYNLTDLRGKMRPQRDSDKVWRGIQLKVESMRDSLLKEINQKEYGLFDDSNDRPLSRIDGRQKEITSVMDKVKEGTALEGDEREDLVRVMCWMPGNLMIGRDDRQWEPGSDTDIEILEKHSDPETAQIIAALALKWNLLKPGNDSADQRKRIEKKFKGQSAEQLLEKLATRQMPKPAELDPGPKEKNDERWKEKTDQSLNKIGKTIPTLSQRVWDFLEDWLPG